MNKHIQSWLILLIFIPTFAIGASFDCSKASSAVEKMICQNSTISKLDDRLAEVYKEVRKIDESIVEEQRNWLKKARACKDEKCLELNYSVRIEELENKLAKSELSKQNSTNIQPALNKNASDGLSSLFGTSGFWVQDNKVSKSNLSCRELFSGTAAVFKRYDSSLMTLYLKLPQKIEEIRVPIHIENIKVSGGIITFDKFDKANNGAIIGGAYQLDTAQKTLRLLRSHTCRNCSESQLMVHNKNLNGGANPEHWCVGNFR